MPSPNLPQGVVDPLNAAIFDADCFQLDGFNTVGNVQGVALADAISAEKATAEWRNSVTAVIRSFCEYVQGLTPITALQIATYFRMPRYTTAQLTNALAISQGEGAVAYDTTLDRIKSSTGATWVTYLAGGDVQPGVHVVADGGGIDDDFDTLDFHESQFELTDLGDGDVSIEIQDGGISVQKLGTLSARSLLGRSANSVGSMAAISGGGANTVAHDDGTSLAFRTLDASMVTDVTLYDQDYSALANNTLVDGAESIGGFSFTCANQATGADTFAIENGTGLHYNASTANTSYDTTTRSATYLRIPTTTLIPTWDCLRQYVIEVYCTTITLPGTNNRILVGFDGDQGGTDRLLGGFFRYNGSVITIGCQMDATITAGIDKSARDVFAVRIDHSGVFAAAGTSSGGSFPTSYDLHGASNTMGAISGSHPLDPTSSFFVIAFVTGGVGGTMDVVVRRIRIRMLR